MSTRRFCSLLMAVLAGSFLALPATATEPGQLHARYTAVCAEIAEVQKSPAYEAATYTERRAMERRVIRSAYDVLEVRQPFQAVAQADPDKKYQLLRASIELQTERSWDCEALEHVR